MSTDNDDIGALIKGAMDGSLESTGASETAATADLGTETQAAPAIDTPAPIEAGDDRPRNPDGTFKAIDKPRDTLSLKKPEAPAAPTAAPAAKEGTQPADPAKPSPEAQPAADRIPPPMNWKGSAKIRWDGLPKPIQQELRELHDNLDVQAKKYQGIDQVLAPHAAKWSATFGNVETALNRLVSIQDFAEKDPAGFLRAFAQQYGIDLGSSVAGNPQYAGTPHQPDPHVAQLERRLAAAEAQLSSRDESSLQSQIAAFANDPAYPYFADVKPLMGALLRDGQAHSLKDAYDMAVYANPQVRAQIMASEAEAKAKHDAERVEAARRAQATNISGSPIPGARAPGGLNGSDGSIAGDVMAAWNAHQSGARI